jgi:hypothetical protein
MLPPSLHHLTTNPQRFLNSHFPRIDGHGGAVTSLEIDQQTCHPVFHRVLREIKLPNDQTFMVGRFIRIFIEVKSFYDSLFTKVAGESSPVAMRNFHKINVPLDLKFAWNTQSL